MNGKDLFRGLEYLDTKYIELAQSGEFSREAFEKEGSMKRHNFRRFLLLAAIVSLLCVLVGCGIVYAMKMQDLKITDRQGENPYISADHPVPQRIIAAGGPQGTKNYQAAKEWYDFEVPYSQTHDRDKSYEALPEYALYQPYSQEMTDKLTQILETYDLKPMGKLVKSETETGLLNYLGIQEILLPNAPAVTADLAARYYEGGQLTVYCNVQMDSGDNRWPYAAHTVCTFSPKGYFDSRVFVLDDPQNWKEWNYTTASGDTFLILYNPNYFEAYAICDQGERMISLSVQTASHIYDSYQFSQEIMSEGHMEQLLEVFDFSLKPQPGDPALLSGLASGYDPAQRKQTQDGFTVELKEAVSDGSLAWVTLGITLPQEIAQVRIDPDDAHPYWNLIFGRMELHREGASQSPGFSYQNQDDGDGLDNTLECVITWTQPRTGEHLDAGSRWSLTLEKMHQEFDQKTVWESHHVWKFDFTFDDDCDYRALEFVSGPTEVPAIIGKAPDGSDEWGSMTITEFTVRTHSISLKIEEAVGYGQLSTWQEEEVNPLVILKDGSAIPFHSYNGSALDESNTLCIETMQPDSAIPLDEVSHILLIDGTTLYPLK